VVITSPTQARNVLSYVLNNWRKHGEDRPEPRTRLVDPFSTGWSFGGWQELAGEAFLWKPQAGYEAMIVYQPRAWMLREGWMRSKCGSCAQKTNLALDGRSGCCSCRRRGQPLDEIFGCYSCRDKAELSVTTSAVTPADVG
jgi:hypothetical protein